MSTFTRKSFLMGCKYWAQWHEYGSGQRFTLYKYIGQDSRTSLHAFKSVKANYIIFKASDMLFRAKFKPFCYDMEEVKKYIETIKD